MRAQMRRKAVVPWLFLYTTIFLVLKCVDVNAAATTGQQGPPLEDPAEAVSSSCGTTDAHDPSTEKYGSCAATKISSDDAPSSTKSPTTASSSVFATLKSYVQESPIISPIVTSTSTTTMVPSYYLLWSPGSREKLFVSSLWMAAWHAFHDIGPLPYVQTSLLTALQSMGGTILLPLGASACCAIQLALNVLGVGCAGFNTYLGPYRPYLVAFLAYVTILSPPTTTVAVRWSLALLPELLHAWNTYMSTTSINHAHTKVVAGGTMMVQQVIELEVPTMNCVACINKVTSSLRQASPRVVKASSWLVPDGGGRASVTILTEDDTSTELDDVLLRHLQTSLQVAGFDNSRVVSIRRTENVEKGGSGSSMDEELSLPGDRKLLQSETNTVDADQKGEMSQPRHTIDSITTPGTVATRIHWMIPSMSCEGCILEINAAAEQAAPRQLVQVTSWLLDNYEGGRAAVVVTAKSLAKLEALVTALTQSMHAAGFDDAVMESMEFVKPVEAPSGAENADQHQSEPLSFVPSSIQATVELLIPSMSCGMCVQAVDESVRQSSSHVLQVESELLVESGGGRAKVTLSAASVNDLEAVVQDMKGALQKEGFNEGLVVGPVEIT